MISIIISTYNREQYISQCLESIAAQQGDQSSWELIIVNNNSTDSTDTLIKEFIMKYQKVINVSYYKEHQQGLSFARNKGIEEAKGDFLVFIDDDAFLVPNYIEELQKALEVYKGELIAFGGKITPYLESDLPEWMSSYLMPLMSVLDMGNSVIEFKQNKFPIGANMGFSKLLIDKVGDFNVNLGRVGKNTLGGEEKDLFFRMRKVKAKIYYFPSVIVQHVVPDARLTHGFIKKQAIGIGVSERIRSSSIGKLEYVYSLLKEAYKWGGSIVLFVVFTLQFKYPKAQMIIRFRSWVTKGLLKVESI
ncbi:MAG: glycosyltransferase family 2 protein [Flavobacteriales bacterium]|jgi:glycosyltransferase involved in cell wall biosynthesis|nr:glycosyltransferase family 2 protein [Flavobacteriales bacterium]